MRKLHLVLLPFLLIGLFISYNTGFMRAIKTNEKYKTEIETDVLKNHPIPECNFGNCPEFQSFDTDSDGEAETVAVVYTTMTSFAGQVWIIDDGKVVFISDEKMMIGVKPTMEHDQENGFIIFYSTSQNPKSNNDIELAYYKYIDGKYILEKTE